MGVKYMSDNVVNMRKKKNQVLINFFLPNNIC